MGLITRPHHQPQVAALARLEMVLGEALEATTLAAVDPAAVERVQADRAGAARVVDPGVRDREVEAQEARGLAARNPRHLTTPHPWMGSCLLIIVFIPAIAPVIIGIVAVVAGQAGRAVQCLGMAILAGRAAVIDASAAIVVISNIRMGTPISRRPVIHGMAGCTVESEQAGMIGRVAMTTCTGCRDLDKPAAFVTALALHAGMPACQWEVAAVVVEIRILPIGGVMAGSTICAVPAIVLIVLPVTGIAVHRCAFVLPVDMARLAVCFRMFPFQFECR